MSMLESLKLRMDIYHILLNVNYTIYIYFIAIDSNLYYRPLSDKPTCMHKVLYIEYERKLYK